MNTDLWMSGLSLFALLVVTALILWFSEPQMLNYATP